MADDDIREGQPKKKKPPPRDDDDEDRPKKKKSIAKDEDDEDEGGDLGSSPLSAIVPVGGSLWALLSFYAALLSCFVPFLGLLAVILGVVAFMTHKHKASYGSVTGNLRAVAGIGIGLLTAIGWTIYGIALLVGAARLPF